MLVLPMFSTKRTSPMYTIIDCYGRSRFEPKFVSELKADVTKFTHHLVLSGESSNAFDDEAVACQRSSLVEAANLN